MKKSEFKSNAELQAEKKRVQARIYYHSKKQPKKGEIRANKRLLKDLKVTLKATTKQLKSNEQTRAKRYKHAIAQRKYQANKNLNNAAQREGATKIELKRLFRKVIEANTEQKRVTRQRGSKVTRRKGLVYESRTVWEGKELANDILQKKINYKKYKGISTKKSLDNLINQINAAVIGMGSRDSVILEIDPKTDNVLSVKIKTYNYEKNQD